jgi:hypothetical protein
MPDDRIRVVYPVEVLETPELDGEFEIWGDPKDADKSVKAWRAKDRKARTWPERVKWS